MKSVYLLISTIIISLGLTLNKANSAEVNKLSHYYWEHRVIITSAASKAELISLENQLKVVWPEIKDRELVVFAIFNSNIYQLMPQVSNAKQSLEEAERRLNKRHTLLIGLDGGSKVVYDNFNSKQIFADIDAMPMRRAISKG